jgi:hypothetical protein
MGRGGHREGTALQEQAFRRVPAETVELLGSLAEQGLTAREIAERLNQAGCRTASGLLFEPMHVYKLARGHKIEIKGRPTLLKETLARLTSLYKEGIALGAIVELLNGEGHRTASGHPWTTVTLSNALQRTGVKRVRNEREFDDAVVRRVIELRISDMSLDRIARVLTEEGFETPLKGRWWPATVATVIEIARQLPGLTSAERQALDKRRAKGHWPKAEGRTRVDRETVEMIVSLRSQTDDNGDHPTFQEIAERLDAAGVPTARKAEAWRASTVRSIWASAEARLAEPAA